MRLRNVVIAGVVAIALLLAITLSVVATMESRTVYRVNHNMMGGPSLPLGTHSVGSIILIVSIGVLVLGGLALLAYLAHNRATPASTDETPMEIIERLSDGGHIDDKEFQRLTESLVS